MAEISHFLTAIEKRTFSWLPLTKSGDPNTFDVYWHAKETAKFFELQLPTELPEKEIGVLIVECVENYFVRGCLIRFCSSQEIIERVRKLLECIQEQKLLTFQPPESYVVALYTWHGCINMAKLLRRTYVTANGEAPYTEEMRWDGFNWLRKCWSTELNSSNPWVSYGVFLARPLVRKRRNHIIDNWIPQESPYWDCS